MKKHHENRDHNQQNRAHDFAEHFGQFLGMLRHDERQNEEDGRVDELGHHMVVRAHKRRHHHFIGRRGAARNGEQRADRKNDGHGQRPGWRSPRAPLRMAGK